MTRMRARVIVFTTAVFFAWGLAESIVRIFAIDWRYIDRLLYLQTAELECHEVDTSPELHYRLREGVVDYGGHRVTVNSLHARGPERPATKAPGVYRIVVVGGSNAYGAVVGDQETWPAQLEQRLKEMEGTTFEVWNYGTSAYVTSQMIARAEWALENLSPDLIIIALTNLGSPGFLPGRSKEELFRGTPWLWFRYVFDDRLQGEMSWLGDHAWLWWINHSRLFRLAQLARVERNGAPPRQSPTGEEYGSAKLRIFVNSVRDQVRIGIFVCPAIDENLVAGYWQDLNVPVFVLRADGKPDRWRKFHPNPDVLVWYASELREWLVRENLVPTGAAADSGSP